MNISMLKTGFNKYKSVSRSSFYIHTESWNRSRFGPRYRSYSYSQRHSLSIAVSGSGPNYTLPIFSKLRTQLKEGFSYILASESKNL